MTEKRWGTTEKIYWDKKGNSQTVSLFWVYSLLNVIAKRDRYTILRREQRMKGRKSHSLMIEGTQRTAV